MGIDVFNLILLTCQNSKQHSWVKTAVMWRHISRILFGCRTEKTTSTAQETKVQTGKDGSKTLRGEGCEKERQKDKEGKIEQIKGALLCLSFIYKLDSCRSMWLSASKTLTQCCLKLCTLVDRYRAVIIEHIQPICGVSGQRNCQPSHLNDSGSIILELCFISHVCTHTPTLTH